MDRAANITKRYSAAKLQFARFGADCPLWNADRAFEAPRRILRELAETPDGARYLCIATQITKGDQGFMLPVNTVRSRSAARSLTQIRSFTRTVGISGMVQLLTISVLHAAVANA